MNWTHRRPFRQQFNNTNKNAVNRPLTFREHFHVPRDLSDQPIDAVRLQLADYNSNYNNSYRPCPVHHREEYYRYAQRDHPYITSLSDHPSSMRRTHSSVQSVSTVETDFVHQRVSTIRTFPTSPSITEREAIINEDNDNNHIHSIQNNNQHENEINQPVRTDVTQQKQQQQQQPERVQQQQQQEEEQSSQCRICIMLMEIVDQQTQQIRQYTEQISQQADLLAKFARRFAGIEEGIDDQTSDDTNESQTIDIPITT